MKSAPSSAARDLGETRLRDHESIASHLARLNATVLERATHDRVKAARAEIARAIWHAELGYQPSILDLNLDDEAELGAYKTALVDIREERARRNRAAAAWLAVERLRGRPPQ